MYADDTLIYNTIHNINDCLQLQNDIIELEKWAKTWQMDFNTSKCEFLKITNKKLTLHFNYHINNEPIKEVQYVKYLGITIDSHMTWREHINVLSHKANTTLAFLRGKLKPCSSHIKAKSYLSYVRPIIEYSSIPYGILTSKKIFIRWKWYKEELPDLYIIIITVLIVSQVCYNLYTGLLWK